MPQLAYLMLSDGGTPPNPSALMQAWADLWPDEDALAIEGGEDGVMVFGFGDYTATVSYMPGPL